MSRREALLGKFRSGSLDRLRRINLLLVELEEGRAGAADVKEIARELHTLKGESRMLKLPRVSTLAHAAEEALQRCGPDDASRLLFGRVRAALELVARWLKGELGEGDAADEALTSAATALVAETPSAPAAQPAAAEPSAAAQAISPRPEPVSFQPGATARERWISVNAGHVDELCERVSEIASEFGRLQARLRERGVGADRRQSGELALYEDFDRCRGRVEDLTTSAWALRLVPVEPALQELAVHARELALGLGKRLIIGIRSAGAQAERTVLESLWQPLVHLVRNAIDHGVEPPEERLAAGKPPEGHLDLQAHAMGPNAVITLSDDGRGIDAAAVRTAAVERGVLSEAAAAALSEAETFELLFRHGFSTRAAVGELSGRGVGLDVVHGAVVALGGSVAVDSSPGRGTRFTLTIPARISKERALVIQCAELLLAVPARQVLEIVRVAELAAMDGPTGAAVRHRGERLPYRSLAALLGLPAGGERWAIVVESEGRRWVFGVPALAGDHELVRRPADALLARTEWVGASATLDDGRLVLIVTLAEVLLRAARLPALAPAEVKGRPGRVLVVDDAQVVRELLSGILRGAGIEVEAAADGRAALEELGRSAFDAVVSDIDMPAMDGFELLRQIRLRSPTLPVIMLSTRASAEDRRQATALGADAYLVKADFKEATLVQVVGRYVGARS